MYFLALSRTKALYRKEAEMDLPYWLSFELALFIVIGVLPLVPVLV